MTSLYIVHLNPQPPCRWSPCERLAIPSIRLLQPACKATRDPCQNTYNSSHYTLTYPANSYSTFHREARQNVSQCEFRTNLTLRSLTLCIVTGSLQSTRVGVNLYAEPPPADIPNPRLAIAFTSSSGPGCAARSTVAHLLELHPRQLATRPPTLLEDRQKYL